MTVTLAYDANCPVCTDTAESASRATGNRLNIEALDSKFVQSALQENKKLGYSKPVVIVEKHGKKKLYLNHQIPRILLTTYGLSTSLKILRNIGEATSPQISGVKRRPFLSGVAGVGLVLSVGFSSSNSAFASTPGDADWLDTSGLTKKEMDPTEVKKRLEKYTTTDASGREAQVARSSLKSSQATGKMSALQKKLFTPIGASFKRGDGTTLTAVCTMDDSSILVRYELSRADTILKSKTVVFAFTDLDSNNEPQAITEVFEANNGVFAKVKPRSLTAAGADSLDASLTAKCTKSNCDRKRGRCYSCRCKQKSLKCIGKCCSFCAGICVGSIGNPYAVAACIGCALVSCYACTQKLSCCSGGIGCRLKPIRNCP